MIYFDMDGVLADFYENPGCVDNICRPGFYLSLVPSEKLVGAIKFIRKYHPEIRFGILSAAPSAVAASEKTVWLEKYFEAGTFSAIYIPQTSDPDCRVSKSAYLSRYGISISKKDILFDDYSRNCNDWEAAGGTAIKVYNGLNCRGFASRSFKGEIADFERWDERDIANYIISLRRIHR